MQKKLKTPFVSVAWLRAMAQVQAQQHAALRDKWHAWKDIAYFPGMRPIRPHELN